MFGHIEYRADGVYYNLHLKDGCLSPGKTITANYVIWVSSGNRRDSNDQIVDQNMYWYHEGKIEFTGDCSWVNPYTQSIPF